MIFARNSKPTVLCILRNMWLHDPQFGYRVYNAVGYEEAVKTLLFRSRCVTGRRIQEGFPNWDDYIYINSTRKIADNPKAKLPVDLEHIQFYLKQHKPDCVIAFSRWIQDAVASFWYQANPVIATHDIRQGTKHHLRYVVWQRFDPPYLILFVPHPATRKTSITFLYKKVHEEIRECFEI